MAYKIDEEKCVGCGACAAQCPVECITMQENGKYQINPDICISCGGCEAVCPVEAPSEA